MARLRLHPGDRVTRAVCPPECNQDECPKHIEPGSMGTVADHPPEPWNWYNLSRETSVRSLAWRIDWDNHGGYWTVEHAIDPDDDPNFPDGVWTDGTA